MNQSWRDRLADWYGVELMFLDVFGAEGEARYGYDKAIVGVMHDVDQPVVVYDETKILNKLMTQGLNLPEAIEWFEYNIARGARYMGPGAPVFIDSTHCTGEAPNEQQARKMVADNRTANMERDAAAPEGPGADVPELLPPDKTSV